jgi:hypothetical protein
VGMWGWGGKGSTGWWLRMMELIWVIVVDAVAVCLVVDGFFLLWFCEVIGLVRITGWGFWFEICSKGGDVHGFGHIGELPVWVRRCLEMVEMGEVHGGGKELLWVVCRLIVVDCWKAGFGYNVGGVGGEVG